MKNKLFTGLLLILLPFVALAQVKNSFSEIRDYREKDGRMIITCMVNGETADFVVDLTGHTAILPEYMEKLKIDPNSKGDIKYDRFLFKKVPTDKIVSANSVSFGNSAFLNATPVFVLEDAPYLRELGVAGVMGGALFRNVVLTIDAHRHKLTMSQPYRPGYIRLDRRMDGKMLPGSGVECPVTLDGQIFNCVIDLWDKGLVELNEADFARLTAANGASAMTCNGYNKPQAASAKTVGQVIFVQDKFDNQVVAENKSLVRSVIGNEILKYGLLSVDYLREKVYFQPFDLVEVKDELVGEEVVVEPGKLNAINSTYFRNTIFDYSKGGEFVYKGDKPVVIDFWANWCGPCKKMLPLMEQLAEKYKDRVIFLKVDADKEKELCNKFNVTALPTLFFLPVNGKPIIEVGAMPEKYEEIIEEKLLR